MGGDGVPTRCEANYDAASDELENHLERLCNFVKKLNGNFDESNVAQIYIDAYVREDRNLMGCGCVRGVKAKGLKVFPEWLFEKDGLPPYLNLNQTKVHGSKIVRLKRRNLWARYKSKIMAEQTGVFHAASPGDKHNQIASTKDMHVVVEHMEWNIKNMERLNRLADQWAKDHGSEVLWLDYEDCRADTEDCFRKIYKFIGVDESHVTGKRADLYKSVFKDFAETETTLDHVANKGEIKELLGVNGWDHFLTDEKYIPIHMMTYEENDLLVDTRKYMGINHTLYGQDKNIPGHGSRFGAAVPILQNMDPETLVVLNGDRDGRVSFPIGDHETMFRFLYRFRKTFEDMTRDFPGAIVASTDSECCASALTHGALGDYFGEDGKRNKRACISGAPGCEWAGDDKAVPWQSFMKELASKRSESTSQHVYLDTSLIAGKAGDLLKMIEAIDINGGEDDRAVLTDFMYHNPNLIILDYQQQILGESRKTKDTRRKDCFGNHNEAAIADMRRLDAVSPEEKPLFMYSPKGLGCGGDEKFVPPRYPVWDSSGIAVKPIIDHIDRVAAMKDSVVLPSYYKTRVDYRQGPEVPYIIDADGIWTSTLIRDRTNFKNNQTMVWRMMPTEILTKDSHALLMDDSQNQGRWSSLQKAVRSEGGFPYFAWYGDFKTCNHNNYKKDSIPLFTTCAMAG